MGKESTILSPVELERSLQYLKGLRIEGVDYAEIDCGMPGPSWAGESSHFDSLDYGMNLALDNGRTVSVCWDWDYNQYEVCLASGPMVLNEGPRYWPASDGWRHVIGVPISSIRVYWGCWEPCDGPPEYYPQDLQIRFEDGQSVTVSAFEFDGKSSGTYGADHVTVFFRQEELKLFGLCEFGPHMASQQVPW